MSETTTRKCCGCHGGYHDSCAAPCECPGGPYDPTPPTPFAVVHRQVGADVWAVRHRNGWDAATLHDPREAEAVADLLNAMRRGGPDGSAAPEATREGGCPKRSSLGALEDRQEG